MKKTFKFLALFLSVILINTSCEKSDDVSPTSVEGKWRLQSYNSEIKVKGENSEKESANTSSENLSIDFSSNGTFSTNSMFSIDELYSEETVTGTYEIKDGFLTMKYKDPETKSDVIFYMKVKSSSSTDLILLMDKECISKTVKALASTDPDEAEFIEFFLLSLETLTAEFHYKKA
jgi:hypothetical protein